MATNDTEYESDPEESKLSLAMRRRVASDDEDDESEEEQRPRRVESRAVTDSDAESEGGVPQYDDDEEFNEEDDEEEVEVVSAVGERGIEEGEREIGVTEGISLAKEAVESINEEAVAVVEGGGQDNEVGNQIEGEEEKKKNEPFSVPTAGAFYMHDDRFRDNAGGGRNRRNFVGKKLWESKDDRKWGHDKFEELTTNERHHEEGRRGTGGNFRVRGKNPGSGRGYARENRSNANTNGNNHNQARGYAKTVRGRGPRRYEPLTKHNNEPSMAQNKQSGRSLQKTSHVSNVESVPGPPIKSTVASSLSSASPPFYPSGASNKEVTYAPKRDPLPGNTNNKNLRNYVPQSNALLRGKNVIGSVGMDKLSIDDSNKRPSPGSFSNTNNTHQTRDQTKGLAFSGPMHFQPTAPPNQARKQPSAQTMGQGGGNVSRVSSPPNVALSINSFESGEMVTGSESSKSKTALVGKGKDNIQGNGIGSFLYNGAQVMGVARNMGVGRGDPNFSGAPTFLPVMQFGGQHSGGMGVPAVGMAFPGYVGQPQGMGNSEMTWLPVLAGAAGALGAGYCPPYINMDGTYPGLPLGQTSSSSKENTEKASNDSKPSQKPELVGDERVQRQNKPRRYSEMNFGQ